MFDIDVVEIVWFVIGIIAIVNVISLIIFLICREIVCWYWKINKLSSQLYEQNELLRLLLVHMGVP